MLTMPRTNTEMDTITVDEETVMHKLNKLNTSKSPGPDNLHPMLIFHLREQLALPLSLIFTKSLEEHKLPAQWKEANVTAIFKKGNRKQAGNYRPISLTSILCKIFESILRDNIVNYMETNKLFTEFQHGFRKGHSCVTQLLEIIDSWNDLLEQGNNVDVIYLDFQKAFDTVPHRRLLGKMRSYGICQQVLGWVESFLAGRRQRVTLGKTQSNWQDVISGVPQGSGLGPVLFLIFINDLPEVVHNLIKLFADDTKIYAVANNENQRQDLQEDLAELCKWSDRWKLKFNASKCKIMHFGCNNNQYKYYMSSERQANTQIEIIKEEKDLGVIFDPSLKFSAHIAKCAAKANSMLGLINRTFSFIDKEMFLTLYKTLVRPHMEYASSVWYPWLKKDIKILERVQKRATKIMDSIKHLSYSDRLRTLGLPTLEYRRKRFDMIQVYKILNNIDHIENSENLLKLVDISKTRGHTLKLHKKICRTERRKNTFFFRVIDIWNSLSDEVVRSKTLNEFKTSLNNQWKNDPSKFTPSL
jgi:hypothetical protein